MIGKTIKWKTQLPKLLSAIMLSGLAVLWKAWALPVLYGDRSMLRLALVNLLCNVVKFTRTRVQTEIEIGCTEGKEHWVVAFIRDSGVGFNTKHVNRLFGVFRRLHRPELFEGTGIGLATATHHTLSRRQSLG